MLSSSKSKQAISLVALTETGLNLARALECALLQQGHSELELLYKPKPFQTEIQARFKAGRQLLMVCASGIIIRTLAPVLADKYRDPAVIALDEHGLFVVPLLSGHEGGANELGRQVSELLQAANYPAQLVLTSAQSYLKPKYTIGMGCERHCKIEHLEEVLERTLAQANIGRDQIEALASIDIKSDEVELINLAKANNWPFLTYNAARLNQYQDQLSRKSDIVFAEVGVYGVAEAAALAAVSDFTDNSGELIVPKLKNRHATCALARSYEEQAEKPAQNGQSDATARE